MQLLPTGTRIETTPQARANIRSYWETVLQSAKQSGDPDPRIRALLRRCSLKGLDQVTTRLADNALISAALAEWNQRAGPFVKIVHYGAKGSYAKFRVSLSRQKSGRLLVSICLASEAATEAPQP